MTTSIPILHLTPKDKKRNEDSGNNSPKLFRPLPIKNRNNENILKYPISRDPMIPLMCQKFQFGGSLPNLNYSSSPQMQNFYYFGKNRNSKLLDIKTKPCCSCIKTKCIKKYCECFANKKSCTNCLCLDCRNKGIHVDAQNKENNPNSANTKEFVFCTCSKSGCNKKYCECYKEGLKCNIKCRCSKCLNCEDNSDKNNDNEKIISLDETRYESGKKSNGDDINDFNVQKISVLIAKSQTYINIEKYSKEDFVLLCKKRKIS